MKKNGFTLIEILGVILLLAVIALITVPKINDVIMESRKNADKASAIEYVKAIEFSLSRAKIDADPANDIFYYPNDTYTSINAPIKGTKPIEVTLTIEAGEVISGKIVYPNYTFTLSGRKIVAIEKTIIYIATNEICFDFNSSTQTITNYYPASRYTIMYPLPQSTYAGCTNDLVIPAKIGGVDVKNIGLAAFTYNDLTSVFFPNTVENIAQSAFSHNVLTNIVWGSNIKSIGLGAFNDNALPDDKAFIYKRNSNSTIDNTTLVSYGGAKRANIVIPSNITTIGNQAFIVNQITSVTIPTSVTVIEREAFMFNDLTNIVIPNSVISIGDWCFSFNDLTSITIPTSVTTIGGGSFANNQLPDNQAFIYARNPDGSVKNTVLMSYGGANRVNIAIPSTVTELGGHSLWQSNITSIVIPSTITKIGHSALGYNLLTTITIPNSVTTIDPYAFNGNNLTSVDIGSGITTIGGLAFSDNNLTTPATIIRRASGSVTLGTNVFTNNGPTGTTTITPTYIP